MKPTWKVVLLIMLAGFVGWRVMAQEPQGTSPSGGQQSDATVQHSSGVPISNPAAQTSSGVPIVDEISESRLKELCEKAALAERRSIEQASVIRERLKQSEGGDDAAMKKAIQGGLSNRVIEAYRALHALHRMKVALLEKQLQAMKRKLEEQETKASEIIERRIDDLLNPNLRWDDSAIKNSTTGRPLAFDGIRALTASEAASITAQNHSPREAASELSKRITECMESLIRLRGLQQKAASKGSNSEHLATQIKDEEQRLRNLMGLPNIDGQRITPTSAVNPPALEQPQRVLDVSQVIREGRALNESGEVVVVRFRVTAVLPETFVTGERQELRWVFSSEKALYENHPLAFSASVTTKVLEELGTNDFKPLQVSRLAEDGGHVQDAVEHISKYFVGKVIEVEGPVGAIDSFSDPGDIRRLSRYSIHVNKIKRIQEAKAVAPPAIDGAKTPAGALSYEGTVLEWVGGDPDGLWEVDDVLYIPVRNATLRLYRVSPISKTGGGCQFEEIGVFKSDSKGRFQVNIPDDLKRFSPTPHTKEWDDWESLLLVTTSAPGFATESTTLDANRGLDSLALSRGTSIKGRLVDENEKPIFGAHVTVNDQSRSGSREEMDEWLRQTSEEPLPKAIFDPGDTFAILAARTPAMIARKTMQWIPTQIEGVVTDKDGRFVIDGIGPDDMLDLSVECIGYNNASIKVIGRDIETVYSRDPFGSGENIAVHGCTLQATLIASDRGSPHSRHRVIKGERKKGQVEASASDASTKDE